MKVFLIALPAFAFPSLAAMYLPTSWADSNYIFWSLDIFFRVVIPLLCLFMLSKKGTGLTEFGLSSPIRRYSVPQFLALCFVCALGFLSYIVVDNIARTFFPSAVDVGYLKMPTGASGLFVSAYYVAASAFFEEVFFRGVLGYVLLVNRKLIWIVAYISVSAFSFVFAHLVTDPASIVALSYLGIGSAVLYVALRNIWPLVIAHAINDTIILGWLQLVGHVGTV